MVLYALIAVFHAEDPRQYTGVCEQTDRLRQDYGGSVKIRVKSTRTTPRKTVDEMESRQLFIGYTVSCPVKGPEGATALALQVCVWVAVGGGGWCSSVYVCVLLLNRVLCCTGLYGCGVGKCGREPDS